MTPDVWAPFVRIMLRYVAGFLIAKGIASKATLADPDLAVGLCYGAAAILSLISEVWYRMARKKDWPR